MIDPFQTRIFKKLKEELKTKKPSSKEDFHIEELWKHFKPIWPRLTPIAWVDHSEAHILRVSKILDSMIPDEILDVLSIEELYLLLAGTICHDVGMAKASGLTDISRIASVRRRHGELGADLLRKEFSDFIPQRYLYGVCEILKNHHGNFDPSISISIPNVPSVPQLALIVRLADELDFGPARAPNWLADIIGLSQDQVKHWREHNKLQPPQILPKVLRIYLSGYYEDRNFVEKAIHEFSNQLSVNLQAGFFGRGGLNYPYIIQDQAIHIDEREHATSRIFYIDPSDGSKLELARNLYNDGKYEWSLSYFKDMFKSQEDYKKYPSYVYHYLKTYEKLGNYPKLLTLSDEILGNMDDVELEADIRSARSLAYYKLFKFHEGINESRLTEELYGRMKNKTVGNMIKQADQHTVTSMFDLARFWTTRDSNFLSGSKKNLQKVEQELGKTKKEHETHYFGRFFGMKAFILLADVEEKGGNAIRDAIKKNSNLWSEAEKYATKAFGGKNHVDRNPVGVLAGTYAYAAIQLHRCKYLVTYSDHSDFHTIYTAFHKLFVAIRNLYQLYENIFGDRSTWFAIKINTLSKFYDEILREIKKSAVFAKTFPEKYHFDKQLDKKLYKKCIPLIYTPIQ